MRILLRVGAEAMHEQILDAGYAQLASEFNSASTKSSGWPHGVVLPPRPTSSDECQLRSKSEQLIPGWVLVNVATLTDCWRLAVRRIGPQGNGLGGPFGDAD